MKKTPVIKGILFWGTALLVLATVNLLILRKENTLANGRTILLRLAPDDPRSLIQGDYMILRYSIARDVRIPKDQLGRKGRIVVSLDENDIAHFVRIHKGESLQEREHLLFYRNRGGLRIGAESFFFQEGDAELYSRARYAELKVDASGASVLVGLRGEDFEHLGRKQESESVSEKSKR